MKDMIFKTNNFVPNENIIQNELIQISHIVKRDDVGYKLHCYAKGNYIKIYSYLKILEKNESNLSPHTCFDWVLANLENNLIDQYRFWLATDIENKYLFLIFIYQNNETKNRELRSVLLKSNDN